MGSLLLRPLLQMIALLLLSGVASPSRALAQGAQPSSLEKPGTTQLTEPRRERPAAWKRVSAEWAGSTLGLGVAVGAGALIGMAANSGCPGESGDFCELGGVVFGGLLAGALAPAAMTAPSYFLHHSLGGAGRWWMGGIGSLLGLGGAWGAMVGIFEMNDGHAATIAFVATGFATAMLPVLFLEIDHLARRDRVPPSRSAKISAGAAPVHGGGMLVLSGRL